MASVGCGMHHALGNGNGAGAALGAQLIKCRGFHTDAAIIGNVRAAHRGREHTVTEGSTSNGNGFAKIRVFSLHSNSSKRIIYSMGKGTQRAFLCCSPSQTKGYGDFSAHMHCSVGNSGIISGPLPEYCSRRCPESVGLFGISVSPFIIHQIFLFFQYYFHVFPHPHPTKRQGDGGTVQPDSPTSSQQS